MNSFKVASIILVQSLFDLYLLILLLRLLLQYFRVDYYNPFSQFVVKATSPLVVPLRRIIPGYWGVDFATVLLLFIVTGIKIILICLISAQKFPNFSGLIVWSIGDLLNLGLKIFFYAVIINIVISWIPSLSRSPLAGIVYRLTEPLLKPVRRIIPLIGGIDISPIPVILILQFIISGVAAPISQLGSMLAMR
jgi:YggT family protein